MGMMDWVNGDEDDADGQGESAPDGDDEFGEEFADDFGEFDGDEGGDDLDGGFDDGGFDDDEDFDDLDGGFDDEFGMENDDGDETTQQLADFEDRLGDLENEVGAISSQMNTVREENKQIGETVDELDDTIRKLLDIYEMVTRGINPFVDDAREMGGLEHSDGAFGLFDTQEEEEENLDPDVANADAEDFFDEDFGDLDAAEGEQRAEAAAEGELSDEERVDAADALEESGSDADAGADDGDDGGGSAGVSFDDLKSEYEENEGWDENEGEAAEDGIDDVDEESADDLDDELIDDLGDAEFEMGTEETFDADGDVDGDTGGLDAEDAGESLEEADEMDVEEADEGADPSVEDDVEAAEEVSTESVEATPHPHDSAEDAEDQEAEDADVETVETDDRLFEAPKPPENDGVGTSATGGAEATADSDTDDSAEPVGREAMGAEPADETDVLLGRLPSSYMTEALAMDWVRYLVSVGGPRGATRALRLYRDFGWISDDVGRALDGYVRLVASPADDASDARLTVEHHTESLSYVRRLAGDMASPAPAAFEAGAGANVGGGSHDGIRR